MSHLFHSALWTRILLSLALGVLVGGYIRAELLSGFKVKVTGKNGDSLTGTLEGFDGTTLLLTSDLAGLVHIPLPAIADLAVQSLTIRSKLTGSVMLPLDKVTDLELRGIPIRLHLAEGKEIQTRFLGMSKGELRLVAERKEFRIPADRITEAEIIPAPPAGPSPKILRQENWKNFAHVRRLKDWQWQSQADFGYTLGRGAHSTDEFYLRIRSVASRPIDRITLEAKAIYGVQDKAVSNQRFTSIQRYDYLLSNQTYLFGLNNLEHDSPQHLNLRQSISLGAGYSIWRTRRFTLSADGGLGYQAEWRKNETRQISGNGLVQETMEWSPNGRFQLRQTFAAIQYVNPWHRQRFLSEINLKSPLSSRFLFSVGINHQFDTQPQSGIPRNSYTMVTGLGITF